jgi:hypothetical protein
MSIDISLTSTIHLGQLLRVTNSKQVLYYGSIADANVYFGEKLNNLAWVDAENSDKIKALVQATRLIDALAFKGTKLDLLEFPRNNLGVVPLSVEMACYEIAYHLLDGYDGNVEIANLAANSQGYDQGRTTYDRSFVLEHIRAGIPSAYAFDLLKPYLCDPFEVNLRRV